MCLLTSGNFNASGWLLHCISNTTYSEPLEIPIRIFVILQPSSCGYTLDQSFPATSKLYLSVVQITSQATPDSIAQIKDVGVPKLPSILSLYLSFFASSLSSVPGVSICASSQLLSVSVPGSTFSVSLLRPLSLIAPLIRLLTSSKDP